jgi:alkylated DNA repair dioxygenase AlkB
VRDLFSANQHFERLPMEDADVSILRGLDTHASYQTILRKLLEQPKWQQREMTFYGRKVVQPRLTAWYGDAGRTYLYSGIKNTPLPWTDVLRELRRRVEDCTDARFNSVLLNLYRNENDSMGFHSDDEKELGQEPVIASLSFGATRTFIFKHKHKKRDLVKLPLDEGTVLLMRGPTQANWQHAINKESRPCGPRVNLTFRQIFTAAELDQVRAEEYARRRA